MYELEARENKSVVPLDEEEVSVCVCTLVCIRSNARVPVILQTGIIMVETSGGALEE